MVVPFQSVSSLSDVQSQIGTLRADGGTAFYSALDEAYRVLQGAQTPQKHVIFLSDVSPPIRASKTSLWPCKNPASR